MPPEGVDLQEAKVEVAVLSQLMAFQGDTSHPVRNIHFEGMSFQHTKETFMKTKEPLLRGDWNIFRGGAVFLQGTENCSFTHCDFENLGGNAVFFSDYNRKDTIRHCLIRNVGASGICFVGNPSAVRSPSFSYGNYIPYEKLDKTPGPKNKDFPKDCEVFDNLIYNTGQIEKQTAGVHISMSMNIDVVHNTIYHMPRAGININDGTWGGHLIKGNDVFETVLETGDHGAFNSWGRDRFWSYKRHDMDSLLAVHPELIKLDVIHPIIIRHNRFRCDHGWDIDLDDGSSNYIIDSNLCMSGGIKNREGFYRTVKNNIMVNNTFHPHVWFRNSHDVFMHNIVMKPYAPIQVHYWGDTVDYNLFPYSIALKEAQQRGTDAHSLVGKPTFYAPTKGDYRIEMTKKMQAMGFQNFRMDNLGVLSSRLKKIARKPAYAVPFYAGQSGDTKIIAWKGAKLKAVETLGEQSALGLPRKKGVYILDIEESSFAYKTGLRKNDVILKIGKETMHSVNDFKDVLSGTQKERKIKIEIFRNQTKEDILVELKK